MIKVDMYKIKMETFANVWIFVICTMHLFLESNSQEILPYNLCDDTINGETVYYACTAEALHLLEGSSSPFTISIDPESATCGEPSDNIYQYNADCTHSSLGPVQSCVVCDQADPDLSHPAENMVDDDEASYWLSRTWLDFSPDNPQLPVNITISFNHSYELSNDMLITFWSSRPKSVVLYKSMDHGLSWEPWQYYYMECADSAIGHGGHISTESPDTVICTESYSRELPYSNGPVVFPVTEDRFELFLGSSLTDFRALYEAFNNTNLDEFLTFTDIRISLLYPMTDGKETLRQPVDLIKYYYGIADIEVSASCFCNLHGRFCAVENGATTCVCDHHTIGVECEMCEPLYNNRTWNPGHYLPYPTGTANECQKCECNEHASSCHFDPVEGHGICDNCTHNTEGFYCERCLSGFYINTSVPLTHPDVCIDCDCEPLGLSNINATCDPSDGQCPCKSLIETFNRRCDRCRDGYYGLLLEEDRPGECKECACNTLGTLFGNTVCNFTDGQCDCKQTVSGRICDTCRDGFYHFPESNAAECRECNCDLGGSLDTVCDDRGQCQCRPNITGLKCDEVEDSMYVPHIDGIALQPVLGTSCTLDTDIITANNPFTGELYALCEEGQSVVFENLDGNLPQPNITGQYIPVVRYSRNESLEEWDTITFVLRPTGDGNLDLSGFQDGAGLDSSCPETDNIIVVLTNFTSGIGEAKIADEAVLLDARCRYEVTLTDSLSATDTGIILIDSIVLLPDPSRTQVYSSADNVTQITYDLCIEGVLPLSRRDITLENEDCADFFFSVMIELSGSAQGCECDVTGSLDTDCADMGGQCVCKPGVGGLQCDRCVPGYFNFTEAGCTACECSELGSESGVCDVITGQCACLDNVANQGAVNELGLEADRKCSACVQNFHGFQSGQGCSECACNMEGSNSTQCNSTTGQCECKQTIGGLQCDQCLPGFYLFTENGCSACNCSEAGSTSIECEQTAGVCSCKPHVQGDKCGSCHEGNFNLQADNPDGCQPCFCYGHGTQCTSAEGYQHHEITADSSQITDWLLASPIQGESNTHYRADGRFQGNHIYAYAQRMRVHLSALLQNVNLTNQMPVIIQGRDGQQLYYRPEASEIRASNELEMNILLHENYWFNSSNDATIDSFNFYAILADLEAVFIQRRFNAVSVRVELVTWPTVEPLLEGNETASNVEECQCAVQRNVQGMSCESCSQGHQRSTSTGDVYDVCVTCDCNGNGETDPPLCDQDTGVCLNCRNGTIGSQCEQCAPHVTAPDCEECDDEYWGLDQDGCQPCNCNLVGSVSAVCDKETGQCVCAPDVEGQLCDVCVDNHYNLQPSGCQECETCYGLVEEQVNVLREMQDNMTSLVTSLQSNDSTLTLGPYSMRKQQTLDNVTQLIEFLQTAQEVQDPVTETIAHLNVSLNSLREVLTNEATSLVETANQTVTETEAILENANEDNSFTEINVREATNLIANTIDPYTRQLEALVAELESLESEISGSSNGTLGQAMLLAQEVLEIEEKTSQINTQAASSLQEVQQNLGTHVTNSAKITDLNSFLALVETQGSDRLAESEALVNVSSGIMADVTHAQSTIEQLQLIDTEQLDQLQEQNENLATRATSTITEIGRERDGLVNSVNVTAVWLDTYDMMSRVNQTDDVINDYLTRLTQAQTDVQEAVLLVNTSLTDAQIMLDITSDFDSRALEVETQANSSLIHVESLISSSEAAIITAYNLSSELGECITQSNTARLTAQQASDTADRNRRAMTSLPSRMTVLQSHYTEELIDLNSKANSIVTSNITQLAPAHTVCQQQTTQTTELERASQESHDRMTSLGAEINQTRYQLESIIDSTNQIPHLNATTINELDTSVEVTEDDFNSRNITEAVRSLREAIEEKRTWLEGMRARKLQLQQQLTRLRDVAEQLVS